MAKKNPRPAHVNPAVEQRMKDWEAAGWEFIFSGDHYDVYCEAKQLLGTISSYDGHGFSPAQEMRNLERGHGSMHKHK